VCEGRLGAHLSVQFLELGGILRGRRPVEQTDRDARLGQGHLLSSAFGAET